MNNKRDKQEYEKRRFGDHQDYLGLNNKATTINNEIKLEAYSK